MLRYFTKLDPRRWPYTFFSSSPLFFVLDHQNNSLFTLNFYSFLIGLFFVTFDLIASFFKFSMVMEYLLWINIHNNKIFCIFNCLNHNIAISNCINLVSRNDPGTFFYWINICDTFFLFLRFTNQRIFKHQKLLSVINFGIK